MGRHSLRLIIPAFFLLLIEIFSNDKVLCYEQGRMAGGRKARAREFPYSVSLRTTDLNNLGHFCGGAIVSTNLVITAAACTDPLSPRIHEVVAGTLNRIEPYPGQQIRTVNHTIPHPDYIWPPYNDISLIFLSEPFEFNENISAISLPTEFHQTYPNPIIISGWGSEQYGLPMSDYLKRATMDTYTDLQCEEFIGQNVTENLLCVGADEGGISACQGDAGAPIVAITGKDIYLAGVLSHFPCLEPNCCGIGGPMDHCPEVSYYVDWIYEQSQLFGGGL